MFRTILLALEAHGPIEPLLGMTRAMAAGREAEVVVFHVRRAGEARSLTVAEEVRELLAAHGLKARAHTALGDGHHIGAAIAEAAAVIDADLIVMGSRGLSELRAVVAGSVSHEVITSSGRPLLLVKDRPPPNVATARIARVLVGLELLDDLHTIMPALDQIRPRPDEVVLFHARQFVPGAPMSMVFVEAEPQAEWLLGSAEAALHEAGYTVSRRPTRQVSADVGLAIAANAEEAGADLIVVASRRPGSLEALFLGSTARDVVHHSRVPVLIAALPAAVVAGSRR